MKSKFIKFDDDSIYLKVNELIEKSNNIVIVTHINPDGDAVGSSLAMYHYIIGLGKKVNIIIDSPLPFNLKFLPSSEKIFEFNPKYSDLFVTSDLIIVLDLNDSRRLRDFENHFNNSQAKKILIDHHISPTINVDLSIVDTDATSTGEIIFKLLANNEAFEINKEIADCLYTAILTDTGGFRYQRTDAETFNIASELISFGADPVRLYDEVYNRIPYNTIRLLAEALKSMELFGDGRISVMSITDSIFKETNSSEDDVEDFVNNTLTVDGTQIGILITEIKDRNEIRISFRSKGDLSIRELAVKFGGGGHINAAGARVFNSDFFEVKRKIIEEAEKLLS